MGPGAGPVPFTRPVRRSRGGRVTNSDLWRQFWTLTVEGLTLGSIYALIALGYTLVYGVLRLINFAHSEVFMVGTFGALWAYSWLGIERGDAQSGFALVGALAL